MHQLFCGDCLEELQKLSDGSIDLLLTDPPYGISKQNRFSNIGRQGVDFGQWDREFDKAKQTAWLVAAGRKVKKGGNVVIFNSVQNLGVLVSFMESNGYDYKQTIRWIKTNPWPKNKERLFITDYELAVWFVRRGGKWTFNRLGAYERPEIKAATTPLKEKKHGKHPTQKPLAVMLWIIERLSAPGAVVCDPFMGSGTTGVASLLLERNFIGIEKDSEYFRIAQERIHEAKEEKDAEII